LRQRVQYLGGDTLGPIFPRRIRGRFDPRWQKFRDTL
jgi:hypothetical protein